MGKWLTEQWLQIRGNVKYDVLKAIAGAVVLGSAYALRQRIGQLPIDVILLGGLCLLSGFLFFVASNRGSQSGLKRGKGLELEQFRSRIVEQRIVTLTLGAAVDAVSTYAGHSLRLELIDVQSLNSAVIGIGSIGIQYAGSNVNEVGKNTHRYCFPRARGSWDVDDSVFYWILQPAFLHFWSVCVEHINPHTKEAKVVVFFATNNPADAVEPQPLSKVAAS